VQYTVFTTCMHHITTFQSTKDCLCDSGPTSL